MYKKYYKNGIRNLLRPDFLDACNYKELQSNKRINIWLNKEETPKEGKETRKHRYKVSSVNTYKEVINSAIRNPIKDKTKFREFIANMRNES